MKHFVEVFAAIAVASGAAPAFAADAGVVAPRPAAPAAAPAIRNVLSLEFGPEFAEATRNLADVYGKASLAHTFANGWIWTGTFQDTYKANAADEQQQLIETTLGYNFKLDPTFTLTSSAAKCGRTSPSQEERRRWRRATTSRRSQTPAWVF